MSVAAGSQGDPDQHGAGGRSRVVPVVADSWEPDVSTAQVYTSHGNVTRRRFDSEYLTKVLLDRGRADSMERLVCNDCVKCTGK